MGTSPKCVDYKYFHSLELFYLAVGHCLCVSNICKVANPVTEDRHSGVHDMNRHYFHSLEIERGLPYLVQGDFRDSGIWRFAEAVIQPTT